MVLFTFQSMQFHNTVNDILDMIGNSDNNLQGHLEDKQEKPIYDMHFPELFVYWTKLSWGFGQVFKSVVRVLDCIECVGKDNQQQHYSQVTRNMFHEQLFQWIMSNTFVNWDGVFFVFIFEWGFLLISAFEQFTMAC